MQLIYLYIILKSLSLFEYSQLGSLGNGLNSQNLTRSDGPKFKIRFSESQNINPYFPSSLRVNLPRWGITSAFSQQRGWGDLVAIMTVPVEPAFKYLAGLDFSSALTNSANNEELITIHHFQVLTFNFLDVDFFHGGMQVDNASVTS